jgi:predicted glutamine amidotransferase
MCGIFGVAIHPEASLGVSILDKLIKRLFLLSESRGKDSAGLVLLDEYGIQIYKRPQRARQMIRSKQYKRFIRSFQHKNQEFDHSILAMGHARMVTNGRREYHDNNQPIIKDGLVCIHNGIIVNDDDLWEKYTHLQRKYEVDTEVLLALVRDKMQKGLTYTNAVIRSMLNIEGANSIALCAEERDGIILATTNGSLYYALSNDGFTLVFASEEYILRQTINHPSIIDSFREATIRQIQPNEGYVFDLDELIPHHFGLNHEEMLKRELLKARSPRSIDDVTSETSQFLVDKQFAVHTHNVYNKYPKNDAFIAQVNQAVDGLRRCSRCILPETFPFIEFDDVGVCNYCHTYQPIDFKGENALQQLVVPHRRKDGRPDVLVPISGGRDSSYGLHYIKHVLGMNPVAYTYDWGLVTDLARRNISRICGQLDVEHILISADIQTKRENVRKNVLAWFENPSLGTVPLFMAGDKQFFYYSNMLGEQLDIDITLYSMNPLERTDFKVGLCGINEVGRKQDKHYALAWFDRLRLMFYYSWHFISNPSYLNSSLLDSFSAFVSYYMIPKKYYILYEYIHWNEEKITSTLINRYNWETASDTESTWRIGDGTASFYNYIYYVGAGFSENDTFRSNQIREGMLDRETALQLAHRDNQPRYEAMRWYAETIGFDFDQAIAVINSMSKKYAI